MRLSDITQPTLHELSPLANVSVAGMFRLRERDLSAGAQALRAAIADAVLDPLRSEITKGYLHDRRLAPPSDISGAYVINTAPGDPPKEYLYISHQASGVRTRTFVGRVKTGAEELAAAAGPAQAPDDAAGAYLIQASLLLRRPPSKLRRFANDEIQGAIVDFIATYHDENGFSPSEQEIAQHVGTVRSVIHRHLTLLRDQGLVTWEPRKSRTLTLVNYD